MSRDSVLPIALAVGFLILWIWVFPRLGLRT
jgi:hypothetical protein